MLPATIAPLRHTISDAVHDLLLGHGDEFTRLYSVRAFDSADARKRPARSTISLVLDGVHGVLGPPVNRVVVGFGKTDDLSL